MRSLEGSLHYPATCGKEITCPNLESILGWVICLLSKRMGLPELGVQDALEMYDALPEIKFLTFGIAILFFVGHFISWKIGGLKHWIANRNPLVWGLAIGGMLSLTLLLRPAETVDFIYFRF